MTDTTTPALPPTYDCPISGEPKPERRKHSREHCTPEMEQLFNGFHNLIDNLKERDRYLWGYTKAMRDSFAELMRKQAVREALAQQAPPPDVGGGRNPFYGGTFEDETDEQADQRRQRARDEAAQPSQSAADLAQECKRLANEVASAPNLHDFRLLVEGIDRLASLAQPALAGEPFRPPKGLALVPIRMTRAMRNVFHEDDWDWPDVLAAAEAITEQEYNDAINYVPSEVVVTKNDAGQIVAVTRQDDDGNVLSVIAESAPAGEVLTDAQLGHIAAEGYLNSEHVGVSAWVACAKAVRSALRVAQAAASKPAPTGCEWPCGCENGCESPDMCPVDGLPADELTRMSRASNSAKPSSWAERAVFEKALKQTWQMIDPLTPAGTPGSYQRGVDAGIAAALHTIRENFDRAALTQEGSTK